MAKETNSFIKISSYKSFVKIKKGLNINIIFFDGEEFKDIKTTTNDINDEESVIEFLSFKYGYYLVYTKTKLTVMLKGSMPYRIFVLEKTDKEKDSIAINVTKPDGSKILLQSSLKYDKIFVFKDIPKDIVGFGEMENASSSVPVNYQNSYAKEGYICIVGAKETSMKKQNILTSIKKQEVKSTVISGTTFALCEKK